MRTYKRLWIPGGTYFFTVNLAERRNTSLLVDHIDQLRDAFQIVKRAHPFEMQAWVILPDHLHCIWRLPEGDHAYAMRWALIKARFSAALPRTERISTSRLRRGERGIWQRRYWEHAIRDEEDWRHHVDYIHFNPVKHGLVARGDEWRWSSLPCYQRKAA